MEGRRRELTGYRHRMLGAGSEADERMPGASVRC
jgi:hypothetical protein